MEELQRETAAVLRELIRFDTVNPPGNERACQEWLAGYLDEAGLDVQLLGAERARPNLVAHLPGAQAGPVLGYLGHVDTVLADAEDWSRDPWSGEEADGFLWGRGALDMKSQVAAEAAAAATLARSGWRPAHGELKLLSVVDEEAGGALGAQWLTREHPEIARCDFLLNEGAGAVIPFDGGRYYGVCCAEKGVFRFSVVTEGVAGHASMPQLGDNALLKMAPLLERLGRATAPHEVRDEPRALLAGLGAEADGDPGAALERIREIDPRLALMIEAMLSVTFAPTRIRASEKINVIPARAVLQVDCRTPPGMGSDEARARIVEVLGGEGFRLEFAERVVGNRSPAEGPLMDAIRGWIDGHDPGAHVVPTMLPAFTDSRWFRDAFPDCTAYGFFPQRDMDLFAMWPLIHGADERIDVRDLGFAATFFADLARELLG